MTDERHVSASDGTRLAYRVTGDGPPLVMLHATLSTAGQLARLARALAGTRRVIALDRRGSGGSRLGDPSPVPAAVHVADIEALLDREGIAAADFFGHSFGGVVALEAAARIPGRVRGVVAYEPPYGPVGPPAVQEGLRRVAAATAAALRSRGPAGAAEAFMEGVSGPGTWADLPERSRAFLASEGGGAAVDSALRGLDPDALRGISAPVTLLAGGASEPFYRPLVDALLARIPGSRLVVLDGLRHPAPITDPVAVAAAILAALDDRRGSRPVPGPPSRPRPAAHSRQAIAPAPDAEEPTT